MWSGILALEAATAARGLWEHVIYYWNVSVLWMDELIFFLQPVRLKLSHAHEEPMEERHEITKEKCFLAQEIVSVICHRMVFCNVRLP